jgi:hypothetical protein
VAWTKIRVTGLREFQTRVKHAADMEPWSMKRGLDEVGQIVVDNALPMMQSAFVDNPRVPHTGKLEGSLRTLSTPKVGRVMEGYPSRVPYAGWFDFGGSTKRKAGGMNRPFLKRGRVLYPAFDAHQTEVVAAMERVLTRIANIMNA